MAGSGRPPSTIAVPTRGTRISQMAQSTTTERSASVQSVRVGHFSQGGRLLPFPDQDDADVDYSSSCHDFSSCIPFD